MKIVIIINLRANLGALESKMNSEKFAIIGEKMRIGAQTTPPPPPPPPKNIVDFLRIGLLIRFQ